MGVLRRGCSLGLDYLRLSVATYIHDILFGRMALMTHQFRHVGVRTLRSHRKNRNKDQCAMEAVCMMAATRNPIHSMQCTNNEETMVYRYDKVFSGNCLS